MLNDLITEYARVRLTCEMTGIFKTQDIHKVLLKTANYLSENQWKCNPETITNKAFAMCAFYEMFINEIGGNMPEVMCYYFSSLVAKDKSLPERARLEGNMHRAFVLYQYECTKQWERILTLARLAPIAEYKGHLDEAAFLDILIMSDVYKAWDINPNSALLSKLKKGTPNVARIYPNLTKEEAIIEGELGHEAIFRLIEVSVTQK